MYRRFVPAATGLLVTLLTCKTLLAASCWVIPNSNEEKDAIIKYQGEQKRVSAKIELPDCSQIVLVSGIIHVLYETQDGITRETYDKPNTRCHVEQDGQAPGLDIVTYHSSTGSKKTDKEVSRLPGLPYGRVFSVERASTFDLEKAGFTRWVLNLAEIGSRKTLYSKSGNDPVVRIPKKLLRPGGKYSLVIEGRNQTYKGGFDILGGAEAEEIASSIRRINNDASATARAKELDELIVFYENNLDYEMELLREELNL